MNRDGALVSLWQNNTPGYTPANTQSNISVDYDVVIAGGGVTGITAALLLQKSGLKCLVSEANTLCFGTSGGTTAHLNNFYDTTYDQIRSRFDEGAARLSREAATEALDLYKKNIETYQIDCGYQLCDAIVYARDEKQLKDLDTLAEAARQVGVSTEKTDHLPLDDTFTGAYLFHGQARLHPVRYVYALAKEFEAAGGIIVQNSQVLNVSGGDILDIKLSGSTVRAKNLLWATHIPPGINLLHFRCAPYRSYAMAVKLNTDYPEELVYDLDDPYHYYRTQEIDGERFLIAGGEDHKTGHEENTDACFTRLESQVRSLFDVKEISFRWSSQFFEPADGLPYIGHLPGNPENVFVATGYGGNGMIYSHVAAITLSSMIATGESKYKHLYHPGRVKPVAGFANFIKENADVVKEFVGGRLSREKIDGLAALAPGEGRVVVYEGKKLAIHKDDYGNIHALNPICTHAKCTVGWNNSERTWDCPCHGGRFDIEGNVLTGPPNRPLEKVDVEALIEKE